MRASNWAWFSFKARLSIPSCSPTRLSKRAMALLAQVTQLSTTRVSRNGNGCCCSTGRAT